MNLEVIKGIKIKHINFSTLYHSDVEFFLGNVYDTIY